MDSNEIVSRSLSELDPETAYGLWRLRADVFVVEQECAYPDLDGRDLEPGTRHVFARAAGRPVAYLRILAEPDGVARIGRVCVSPEHRSAGLAGDLMRAALDEIGHGPSVLGAQAYLQSWYERFGYVVDGPEYDEDSIAHVPMLRASPSDRPRDPAGDGSPPGHDPSAD